MQTHVAVDGSMHDRMLAHPAIAEIWHPSNDDDTAKMNAKRKTEEGETLPSVELKPSPLKSSSGVSE